ncbi:MAG: hypothetical protein WBC46_03655 [Nitrospira sp.]
MRQSKCTETQIVSILKEADAGRPPATYRAQVEARHSPLKLSP